jgi:hypothetical protein
MPGRPFTETIDLATKGDQEAREELKRFFLRLEDINSRVDAQMAAVYPYARILGQRGWTIPSWESPYSIPELIAHTDIESLEAWFVQQLGLRRATRQKQLFRTLTKSGVLERWCSLLAECEEAYVRRSYLVVVPSLLAVLEGVLAQVSNTFGQRKPVPFLAKQLTSQADSAFQRVGWVALEAFVGEVFRPAPFTGTTPLAINRHWIAHGRIAPAWTKADCLRLFLALETISLVAAPLEDLLRTR